MECYFIHNCVYNNNILINRLNDSWSQFHISILWLQIICFILCKYDFARDDLNYHKNNNKHKIYTLEKPFNYAIITHSSILTTKARKLYLLSLISKIKSICRRTVYVYFILAHSKTIHHQKIQMLPVSL